MGEVKACTGAEALERLREGNGRYLDAVTGGGDISRKRREKTLKEGQSPYAIIITCSDSRVIPESIFDAGIGDLGDETDDYQACCLNVRRSVQIIEESLKNLLKEDQGRKETQTPTEAQVPKEDQGLMVMGALYHLEDGHVEFL